MPRKPSGKIAQRGRSGQQPKVKIITSLLDEMKEHREYESIAGYAVDMDLRAELQRGLKEIEDARGRPCICYIANIVKPGGDVSISSNDDLPFREMVASVPAAQQDVDMLIVSPGGQLEPVARFVDCLRSRFDTVEVLLPDAAMSAGTLWALSGDRIWMRPNSHIGPIDPQVRGVDGQSRPAQSILHLLSYIKLAGEDAMAKGMNPPWHLIRMIDTMDKSQVGDAINFSQYSIRVAAEFLEKYKFRNWSTHSTTGTPVTPVEKKARALEVAVNLCNNEKWGSHSHGISRDVAERDVRLKIDHTESIPDFDRAMRRFWALMYWLFDNGEFSKVFLSQKYLLLRKKPQEEKEKR